MWDLVGDPEDQLSLVTRTCYFVIQYIFFLLLLVPWVVCFIQLWHSLEFHFIILKNYNSNGNECFFTPFTQLLPTRICFTNAGVNTYGAEIHKVRKHAINAFPSFLFLILLFRLYVKEPFSGMMERQNNRLV